MNNPLTLDDWERISPEMADYIRKDESFIGIVKSMLEADEDQIDTLIGSARAVLKSMHSIPVTDEMLAREIDGAVWLLQDPDTYYQHAGQKLAEFLLTLPYASIEAA